MIVISLLVIVFLLLGVGGVVAAGAVRERDVAWLAGSDVVPTADAEVYGRYLARHRRHRLVGGVLGAALAVVVGVRNYGSVQIIGAGNVSPFADVFFCTVVGILAGALSAETYRLAQPRGTVATASLVPREKVGLPGVILAARLIVALTVAWGAGTLALTGDGGGLGVAVLGVLLAVLAGATRAATTGRRRPVRSVQAVRIDLRIRSFAGRSVSWLQLSTAVLTASWALSLTPLDDELGWVLVVPVIAGLVVAVVALRRASPRPRRGAGLVGVA